VLVVSIELTVRVLTVAILPTIVLPVRVLTASVLKNPRTPMILLVVIVELVVRVLTVRVLIVTFLARIVLVISVLNVPLIVRSVLVFVVELVMVELNEPRRTVTVLPLNCRAFTMSVAMLERVLIWRVLMTTLSAVKVLAVNVEISIVPIVAFMDVSVLVSIVEFAVIVLTTKDVSEISAIVRVLAVRVLKTAFGPVTVLTERVDRTVVPLAERVLKKAVAPVRVLTLKVLVVKLLIAALFPIIVLAVRLLMVAVAVVRLGRLSVLVISVLNAPFVPASVLTWMVLTTPFDAWKSFIERSIVLMIFARRELVVRELKDPNDPWNVEADRFLVWRVDAIRSCDTAVRGDVIARVEPDVIVMAFTLDRFSVFRPSNWRIVPVIRICWLGSNMELIGVIVLIVKAYVFKSMTAARLATMEEMMDEISSTTLFFAYAANEGKL
jgi:hypothetical protein